MTAENTEMNIPSDGDTTCAGDATDAKGFGKVFDNRQGFFSQAGSLAEVNLYTDVYKMDHKKRGIAVIISNKVFEKHTKIPERSGTDVDATNLRARFKELNFDVFVFKDVNKKELSRIVHDAAQTDHKDNDCFCMTILTHGEQGILYMTDGIVPVDDIFESFKGHNSKTLIGKPKLFFIQACRGTKLDRGVEVYDNDMADASVPKIPSEADFLIAYSVVPGFFSWRNSANGSWFAQALTDVLRTYGHNTDLLTMMTRVNKKVAFEFESNATQAYMNKMKQIPCITSMLTKDVYFLPKEVQQ